MFAAITFAALLSASTGTVQGSGAPQLTFHDSGTFEEADLKCRSEGAVLASPINEGVLNAMREIIGVNNKSYLTGIKFSKASTSYVSIEGVQLNDMPSVVTDMARRLDSSEGNCISMDQDGLRIVPCCARLPYMCYKAHTEQNSTHVDNYEGYQCFENLGGHTRSCYKKHPERKTWNYARAACEAEGALLVVLDNNQEARTLQSLNWTGLEPYVWTGLRNWVGHGGWLENGRYAGPSYNEWLHGRPFDWMKQCVVFYPTGEIDNIFCYAEVSFICERKTRI